MLLTRPGQRTYITNWKDPPCYQWLNPLVLSPCSIAFCMFTRGYIMLNPPVFSVNQDRHRRGPPGPPSGEEAREFWG